MTDDELESLATACGLYGVRKAAAAYAREVLSASAPAAPMNEQEAFEAWAISEFELAALPTRQGSGYRLSGVDDAWSGWQARAKKTAAPAQSGEPVAIVRDNPDDIGTIIEATRPLEVGTQLYLAAPPLSLPAQAGEALVVPERMPGEKFGEWAKRTYEAQSAVALDGERAALTEVGFIAHDDLYGWHFAPTVAWTWLGKGRALYARAASPQAPKGNEEIEAAMQAVSRVLARHNVEILGRGLPLEIVNAARAAAPQAGAGLTDAEVEAFATDARVHEASAFTGNTKVASHDNVVWAIRRALRASHPTGKAEDAQAREQCINCGLPVDPNCHCERGRAAAQPESGGDHE